MTLDLRFEIFDALCFLFIILPECSTGYYANLSMLPIKKEMKPRG